VSAIQCKRENDVTQAKVTIDLPSQRERERFWMLYIDMSEMQPWVTFTFEVHISFTYFVQLHISFKTIHNAKQRSLFSGTRKVYLSILQWYFIAIENTVNLWILAFFKELSKFDVFVILSKVLLIKLAPHSNGCENYACIIEKKERERGRKERERERESTLLLLQPRQSNS